jgi:hypothetical protein
VKLHARECLGKVCENSALLSYHDHVKCRIFRTEAQKMLELAWQILMNKYDTIRHRKLEAPRLHLESVTDA